MRKWIAYLVCFFSFMQLHAVGQDSLRWSLLTCQPGREIYQLFGHTALRCEKVKDGTDVVFNYGLFSFDTPHFILRFIRGDTDYALGAEPFSDFVESYRREGRGIFQQRLNLTPAEAVRLWNALLENYKPENRIYRYNYFFNNCTSKVRDRIEECVDGKVVYPTDASVKSFRSIVHEYTKESAWDEFGIDLLLGQDADAPVSVRERMFAPFYLSTYAKDARIVVGDTVRNLVGSEGYVVAFTEAPSAPGFFLSPFVCAVLLLLITMVVMGIQIKQKRICWGWDLCLFGAQGLAGIILFFLMFFSVQPTVDSNWLFMLLNPIPLFYLPFMIRKDVKRQRDAYHAINVSYLIIFMILMPLVRQTFNASVVPLALCLLVTSASHWLIYKSYP